AARAGADARGVTAATAWSASAARAVSPGAGMHIGGCPNVWEHCRMVALELCHTDHGGAPVMVVQGPPSARPDGYHRKGNAHGPDQEAGSQEGQEARREVPRGRGEHHSEGREGR